ncbi:hypothetical protein F4825DRAFT_419331 [Nemania diffusa]|nr:hypothetical protein F4825DRAFT_419331 [Nemania diffusa]
MARSPCKIVNWGGIGVICSFLVFSSLRSTRGQRSRPYCFRDWLPLLSTPSIAFTHLPLPRWFGNTPARSQG